MGRLWNKWLVPALFAVILFLCIRVANDIPKQMCIRDSYMGSITIDEDLMDAANMIAGEKVYIADNNNGERFETCLLYTSHYPAKRTRQ